MSWVFYLCLGVGLALVFSYARFRVRRIRHGQPRRGTAPGQGYTTMHASITTQRGNTQTRDWHVPRDPQQYAKSFVPKSKEP